VKPRDVICALAALALGLCASGCSDGDSIGIPVTRPLPPFGTEPSPVTGSEPTTGGNDPLPQPEVSVESLCSTACTRLQSECPGATTADCVSSCASTGLSFPSCVSQFRAFVSCVGRAPLVCNITSIDVPECNDVQFAFGDCVNATGV